MSFHKMSEALDREVHTRSSLSNVLYQISDDLSFLEKYAIDCQMPSIIGLRTAPTATSAVSAAMESSTPTLRLK